MHVEDTRTHSSLLLLQVSCCHFESHLLGVEKVPVLVHVVVIRVEPLLTQIAEVVLGDVALGAIVQD